MITPAQRAEIRRLYFGEHWKIGTIAAALGVHHETVRVALQHDTGGVRRGVSRPSALDPFLPFIRDTLTQYPRLRATRLREMLRLRGYPGSAVQVRRLVRRLRPQTATHVYRRVVTLAGEQAQVDWWTFGTVRIGHGTRTVSGFVMVLGYSRALFALFTLDQTLESFLRGHVAAFETLGGSTRTLVYDNLRSAVLDRRGTAIQFYPRLLELAGHYHFAPRPCTPARGNEKGKVERQIQYLRHAFFAARPFRDLDDLNAQFRRWRHAARRCGRTPGASSPCSTTTGRRSSPPRLPPPSRAMPSALAPSPICWRSAGVSRAARRPSRWPYPTGPASATSTSGPIAWRATMPSPPVPTTLMNDLRRLGLLRTAEDLNDILARATRLRWSPTVLLEHIVTTELEERRRRSIERRLTAARLGRFKPIVDWDWNWPTALDRPALERVLALDFLDRAENVLLVGAQGLGKTMLAKNIVHQVVLAGHSARFITASDLLLDLNGQETARALERRLRHYARPALLAIDEIDSLAYDAHAADLLFQIVSRRYEHRPLLLTTNLAFKHWDTTFPNASCAVALIDRLTHHAEIVVIEGDSYRKREAELSQKQRRTKTRKRP